MNKAGNLLVAAILCLSLSGPSALAKSSGAGAEKKSARTETGTEAKTAGTEEKPVKLQVSITNFSKSVKQGDKATVAVNTAPGAKASITVKLKSGPSKAAELKPQKADASGNVNWTWTVAKNTSPGDVPFTVNATLKGKKAEASGVIKVEKAEGAAASGEKAGKSEKSEKTSKSEKATRKPK